MSFIPVGFYGQDEYDLCPVCKVSVRLRRDGTMTGHILPTQVDNTPCAGRGMLPAYYAELELPVKPKRSRRKAGGSRR